MAQGMHDLVPSVFWCCATAMIEACQAHEVYTRNLCMHIEGENKLRNGHLQTMEDAIDVGKQDWVAETLWGRTRCSSCVVDAAEQLPV